MEMSMYALLASIEFQGRQHAPLVPLVKFAM